MKIALLTNYNSYCGREYAKKMEDRNVKFNLISFSTNKIFNFIEDKRTNSLWKPVHISHLKHYKTNHYKFKNLRSKSFIDHLKSNNYDIGIQGGVGEKINSKVINNFTLGILNFHPGDITFYRGSSSPERQIIDNKKIRSCCHLITEELDMGDIISLKKLELDYSSYYSMRSTLYPQIALHMVAVLKKILHDKRINILKKAPTKNNKIFKFIGEKKIKYLIKYMKNI